MPQNRPLYLVVDDDPGDVEILRRCLEAIPGETPQLLEAGTRENTLKILAHVPLDLIFLDYSLGAETGLDLLEAVRNSGFEGPIVMLTGQGNETVAVQAMHAGVADYLPKDKLAPDMLQRVIGHTLTQARMKRQIEVQQAELERLARTDELTGLANRRSLMEFLEQQLQQAARYELPLSLLMLDLDHFKEVNDHHGHPTGDRVLAEAAEILRAALRESDLAGRYGGEEFCAVLPHTALQGASKVANRIRRHIERHPFPTTEGEKIRVTCSIGLIERRDGETDLNTLVDAVDQALYAAKEAGRNTTITRPAMRRMGATTRADLIA